MLFKILKDKDDYLDATMLIQEIILQNPKPYNLHLTDLSFLILTFLKHIVFFFSLCFLLTGDNLSVLLNN